MLLSFQHRQLSSLSVAWASQMGAASCDLVEGPPGGVSGAQRVKPEDKIRQTDISYKARGQRFYFYLRET